MGLGPIPCPGMFPSADRRGLTLVELLFCVAIVGILGALVSAGMGTYRERARGLQCMAMLRGVGAALQIYAAESESHLPSLPPDNVELGGGGGKGALDIRFELAQYDSALWMAVCPSDPRLKQNPNVRGPTYVSYIYLPEEGLDLGKVEQPVCIVRDGGYYHGHPGNWKASLLFSDQHLEMQKW